MTVRPCHSPGRISRPVSSPTPGRSTRAPAARSPPAGHSNRSFRESAAHPGGKACPQTMLRPHQGHLPDTSLAWAVMHCGSGTVIIPVSQRSAWRSPCLHPFSHPTTTTPPTRPSLSQSEATRSCRCAPVGATSLPLRDGRPQVRQPIRQLHRPSCTGIRRRARRAGESVGRRSARPMPRVHRR